MPVLMRTLVCMLIILFAAISLNGRDSLTGVVSDKENDEPLGAVSVRIIDSNGRIKKFSISAANGFFTVSLPAGPDTLKLQLAKMGYRTIVLGLDTIAIDDTLRVSMPVEAVALAEVGVRAKRIRENGDTITYNVGQFAREQDRSIGEVMNRMTGLEVKGNSIKYQGTDINRLYVEGTDMTGGNHSLVTDNVQAKDVRAVDVLENHQPMQVLRGLSFSDQAAVNLRLKDGSKAKTTIHGDVGAGYGDRAGFLYIGELFAMTIKGSFQNITSLKLNNRGNTLGSGASGWGQNGETLANYISIGSIGGEGNSIFNRSACFSTATTWKNRQGGQWRMTADYGYDHIWADRNTVTTYYLPEGNRIITENRHADNRTNTASLTANYELNQKTYYLNNNFTFSSLWDDTKIDITGTLANFQKAHTPAYDVANRLKIIRRFGEKHLVTFNSTNQWLCKPHRLHVELPESSVSSNSASYGSHVSQTAFFTDERASYGFIMGRVIATVEGGLAAFIRHLDSGMSGKAVLPDIDTGNDFSTDYIRVFAQPKFEINLRRVSLRLLVPLNYYSYFFGGALENRNEVFVSPEFSVQWKPDRRNKLLVQVSSNRNPASLGNILRGEILSDYRTFNAGIEDYYSSSGQSVNINWELHDTKKGWFVNASATQYWDHQKYGVAQMLAGDYIVNYFRAEPSESESTRVYFSANKSFDANSSSLRFVASGNRGTGTVYTQGKAVSRETEQLTAGLNYDFSFCKWLNGDYGFIFNNSIMKLRQMASDRINSYTHNLSLSFTPGKWIVSLKSSYELQRVAAGRHESRIGMDAYIGCRLSGHLDIRLNGANLLDRRKWVSRSFSELGSVESVSWQRGRQVWLTLRIFK